MKNPKLKSKPKTIVKPKMERQVAVHRVYWTVFWRVKGHEYNISCSMLNAAAQAVRCMDVADVIILAKCHTESAV